MASHFWGDVDFSSALIVGFGCALCIASFLLNRWPQLLWRTHRCFKNPPRNIAHRGGQAERPENTITAFTYAVNEVKCRMIELDVRRTKDGHLIVAHDDDLCRTTGKHISVRETNLCDIPKVLESGSLGSRHMEFVPDFEGFAVDFAAQPIPLLEEVFQKFPDTIVNVDITCHECGPAIQETIALLHKYKRLDRTVFGGFNQRVLNQIKAYERRAIVSAGPSRAWLILLAYYCGILPFMSLKEQVWEIPVIKSYYCAVCRERCSKYQASFPGSWALLLQYYSSFLGLLAYKLHTNPAFISALKRRGLVIFGWVVNTREEFKDGFLRIGCDGLMTDRPSLLRAWLEEHGHNDMSDKEA